MFRAIAAASVLAAAVQAHVEINYPTGEWDFTSEQQESGAVCGGGSRPAALAWGTEDAFVSISGDEGNTVRILLATSGSASENATVQDTSSFPIVLSEGATFSSSGNLCLPVFLPDNVTTGARGTVYVEVNGDDGTLSSCAEVSLVPANTGSTVVVEHGGAVINSETGANMTVRDYYCSNSTIAARACSCHCHGASEHCGSTCTEQEQLDARAQCEAGGETHDEHGHDEDDHDHDHSESAAASATTGAAAGSVGSDAAQSTGQPDSGAGKIGAAGGLAAVFAVAGVVLLQ
ncbi:uncharacterized protein JCM10292_004799 [Rhodotorula paludigena]|uniref:uncharacterized protein n=1 Tax=Rhodotorula paludigena TaxID=86838 RepID=UPI003176379F